MVTQRGSRGSNRGSSAERESRTEDRRVQRTHVAVASASSTRDWQRQLKSSGSRAQRGWSVLCAEAAAPPCDNRLGASSVGSLVIAVTSSNLVVRPRCGCVARFALHSCFRIGYQCPSCIPAFPYACVPRLAAE